MAEVIMYCSDSCPFCQNAEKLLLKKGATINKKNVDADPALWDEIEEKTGRDTVPQIFINGKHIGGFDDLTELDMDDELEPMLAS
ncbi:MAG: glutaredoxin 3 [Gammaproteobacteria bacterium]|nr:glutaredoxin 3 [Gammaproteobacteria bacterium]